MSVINYKWLERFLFTSTIVPRAHHSIILQAYFLSLNTPPLFYRQKLENAEFVMLQQYKDLINRHWFQREELTERTHNNLYISYNTLHYSEFLQSFQFTTTWKTPRFSLSKQSSHDNCFNLPWYGFRVRDPFMVDTVIISFFFSFFFVNMIPIVAFFLILLYTSWNMCH